MSVIPRNRESLQHQFERAINQSFSPGHSKRCDRNNVFGNSESKVYSYNHRKSLISQSYDFCKYIKYNYIEVKRIRDIEPRMVQSYIDDKVNNGCGNATVKQYISRLNKLSILCSNMTKSSIKLTEGVKMPKMHNDKLRNKVMLEADYKRIINTTSKSPSLIGVKLSYEFGLRVSEIPKLRITDCHASYISIVDSKGGRSREIPILTKSQREAIKEFKSYSQNHNQINLGIKADSINRWLNRRMKEIGITTYTDSKTSIHALRKAYAERIVQHIAKENKCSKEEAWRKVSTYLGHGENRKELFKIYCPNLQKSD